MVMNEHEKNMITAMLRVYFDRDNAEIKDYFTPLASMNEAVEEWIKSLPCNYVTDVPFAVRKSIIRKFLCLGEVNRGISILAGLRWYGDCYGFQYADMFHGVEVDGYIHT